MKLKMIHLWGVPDVYIDLPGVRYRDLSSVVEPNSIQPGTKQDEILRPALFKFGLDTSTLRGRRK